MKKTAIVSLYQYLKGSHIIGIGTTAVCYLMKDKRVLKLFINTANKKYLFDKYDNVVDHFEKINDLKNSTYIVPEEVLIKDKKCIGYIYGYINSKTLKNIRLNTKIDALIYGYDNLYEDTKEISSKKFHLFDVHDRNILFNGNYNIIDLDKGTFEDNISEEQILKENMDLINKTIIYSLLRVKEYEIIKFYDVNLRDLYRENIERNYKGMKSFLKEFQKYRKDINTVFDMKIKSKNLVYSYYNDYYKNYI